MLTILPTSRAIRSLILKEQESDGFLPSYITMSEFMQRVVLVDGFKRVDDDMRTLLLLQASDFSAFSTLGIERNFFTFLQNSAYIFRFFEELSGELVDIDSLQLADTYGDYEEHINILKELYVRYETLCEEKKVIEPIFLPKKYKLNKEYLISQEEISLIAEGYLTNFELKILKESSEIIPTKLHFHSNKFNKKMQEKFLKMGIDVSLEGKHIVDLSNNNVQTTPIEVSQTLITCESFSQRVLQAGFVKQKIYEFVKNGIEPEKIVVVLPDESFARELKRFDDKCNFNFAMGESLEKSKFVHSLDAAISYLDNPTVENRTRLQRIGFELLDSLRSVYKAKMGEVDLRFLIDPFIKKESDGAVLRIVDEESYYFEKLLFVLKDSSVKSVLHLFLNRLKNRSVDDVRGGKITVMGLLETRVIDYEGVIVVDFNEGTVPRRSQKDLFLNSQTRIRAGLPGAVDRQALQKLYYNNLFMRAKEVAISYVDSVDTVPSRFLMELGIETQNRYDESSYATTLFNLHDRQKIEEAEIEQEYDFTKYSLSATGLKTFLSCKRKFYYRYIKKLSEHKIEKDFPQEQEIGNILHEALKEVYQNKDRFEDRAELKQAISISLKKSSTDTIMDRYLQKLWLQRLEPFIDLEIERFKDTRVVACEKSLSKEFEGIRINGTVDRIDETTDGLVILDYKSGSYPIYTKRTVDKADDFQLEFYNLLAQNEGDIYFCGYYDLKKAKIVKEELLHEKQELLKEHFSVLRETKSFNFEKTENLQMCKFCPYTYLCSREL